MVINLLGFDSPGGSTVAHNGLYRVNGALLQLRRDRDKMEIAKQHALSRRHEMLLQRRADNLDKRQQLADLQRFQGGFTRPWTFSYGVTWPRETYAKYRRI